MRLDLGTIILVLTFCIIFEILIFSRIYQRTFLTFKLFSLFSKANNLVLFSNGCRKFVNIL